MLRARALLVLLAALVAGCGGGSGSTTSKSHESGGTASTPSTSSPTPPTSTAPRSSSDISELRAALVSQVRRSLPGQGLPPAYTKCVVAKFAVLPGSQLQGLTRLALKEGRPAAHLRAVALGLQLGRQCLREGQGIAFFRAKFFISSIRTKGASSGLSRAFVACLVQEAQTRVSNREIIMIALLGSEPGGRARAQAQARAIGARLARECVRKGIPPK